MRGTRDFFRHTTFLEERFKFDFCVWICIGPLTCKKSLIKCPHNYASKAGVGAMHGFVLVASLVACT